MAPGEVMSARSWFGPGFVYIAVSGGGSRKIGLSVDPVRRANNIGGCDVEHTIRTTNMRWLEKYLHDAFYACRCGTGEWFNLTEEDMKLLRGIEFANCENDLPHEIQSLYAQPRPSYAQAKLDSDVHPLARAAAALEGISTQEFISNAVNEAASKVLNHSPIKRRPPKPKKRASD